jgi:hypothetical protein
MIVAEIAEHCIATKAPHAMLGYYRIGPGESPTSKHLRRRIIAILGPGYAGKSEMVVARHHFPLPLLLRNGSRHRIILRNTAKNEIVDLPPLESATEPTTKTVSSYLNATQAKEFGLKVQSEMVPEKPGYYIQAPLASKQSIFGIINSWDSKRASRLGNRNSLLVEDGPNVDSKQDSLKPQRRIQREELAALGFDGILRRFKLEVVLLLTRRVKPPFNSSSNFDPFYVAFQENNMLCDLLFLYSQYYGMSEPISLVNIPGNNCPVYCRPCLAWCDGSAPTECLHFVIVLKRTDVGHCNFCPGIRRSIARSTIHDAKTTEIHPFTND